MGPGLKPWAFEESRLLLVKLRILVLLPAFLPALASGAVSALGGGTLPEPAKNGALKSAVLAFLEAPEEARAEAVLSAYFGEKTRDRALPTVLAVYPPDPARDPDMALMRGGKKRDILADEQNLWVLVLSLRPFTPLTLAADRAAGCPLSPLAPGNAFFLTLRLEGLHLEPSSGGLSGLGKLLGKAVGLSPGGEDVKGSPSQCLRLGDQPVTVEGLPLWTAKYGFPLKDDSFNRLVLTPAGAAERPSFYTFANLKRRWLGAGVGLGLPYQKAGDPQRSNLKSVRTVLLGHFNLNPLFASGRRRGALGMERRKLLGRPQVALVAGLPLSADFKGSPLDGGLVLGLRLAPPRGWAELGSAGFVGGTEIQKFPDGTRKPRLFWALDLRL
jgi:hypothetical protein